MRKTDALFIDKPPCSSVYEPVVPMPLKSAVLLFNHDIYKIVGLVKFTGKHKRDFFIDSFYRIKSRKTFCSDQDGSHKQH